MWEHSGKTERERAGERGLVSYIYDLDVNKSSGGIIQSYFFITTGKIGKLIGLAPLMGAIN